MAPSIDIPTLRLCSMLASAAFGLVFLCIWHRQRSALYLVHWAASSLLYAAAMLGFQLFPGGALPGGTLQYALLGVTDILVVTGVRSFDGRPPFVRWLILPPTMTALGHALPAIAAKFGIGGALAIDLGETAGLAGAMAFCGIAILRDRDGHPRCLGRRIAGLALLAYLPAYACAMIGRVAYVPSHDLVALLPMLSDQLLLGVLNLALLAMPVERAHALLQEAALRDPLTGAWNRAGLAARAAEIGAAGAAVVAIDVDHFKAINDRFGHAAGDDVLVALAREAGRLAAEQEGEIARIGGDEFVAILPACSANEARAFAARLRLWSNRHDDMPDWTVSIGLASIEPDEGGVEPALKRADLSLYRAKALGRDRVAAP